MTSTVLNRAWAELDAAEQVTVYLPRHAGMEYRQSRPRLSLRRYTPRHATGSER